MPFQPNPYSLPLLISALVAGVMSAIAWRRRAAPGAFSLTLNMLGASIWAAGEALRWATTTLPDQMRALSIVYVGAALVPTTYFTFVLEVTHRAHWLTRRNLILLALMPLAELALVWTDGWHHLIHTRLDLIRDGDLLVLHWERGPAYWIAVLLYPYALIVIATLLLAYAYLRAHGPYRTQLGLILLAASVPFIASAISQFGLLPDRYLDLAPFAFTAAGPILAYALFRHRLLDLVPVARSVLIESMSDGVIVVDSQNRIVDINPAARRYLEPLAASPIGQNAEAWFAAWPHLVERYRAVPQAHAEIEIEVPTRRYLDLRITSLHDRRGALTGRLVIVHDITQRKQAEQKLHAANQHLRQQLEQIQELQARLREEAIRDPLTGLYNRRYLEETLRRELSRAAREHYPVSLVMIDLDNFKTFNDTYGHEAGDRMLQALSAQLQAHTRAGDIVCRYGGEEFLITLLGISLDAACERAEEWRAAFAETVIPYGDVQLRGTLSLGVATFPDHGDTIEAIIRAADRALYRAKAAGRNRVWVGQRDTGQTGPLH